ncbi:MAG: type I-E CRISPR-associated protein Cas6/Cse3/CasE [Nitrospiraceae bacterium]|nr:MAG: type I-E CRISPR-associated protein Cas6/Cse3/CasE [Nitrospiraceae bacterium]
MYLSKILHAGAVCRNPYEIHRTLWQLFPKDAQAKRDFLFHVEKSERTGALIWMQSERKPEASHNGANILGCREYQLTLQKDQRLRFLLVANPVKTINDENGRTTDKGDLKKCRVPLIRDDEQRDWLSRKLEPGADPEELFIDPRHPLYFRKSGMAGKIKPVVFQGILKVVEPEAFVQIIHRGIGPAKAFGCGLMLVRQV